MIGEPLGINLLTSNYVIGVDCYWKNGAPVNAKYWSWFKEMEDHISDGFLYQALRNMPMAFTEDMIRDTFNSVHHMISDSLLRDSVFAFKSWVKSVDRMNIITIKWDEQQHSFVLYLPSHKS